MKQAAKMSDVELLASAEAMTRELQKLNADRSALYDGRRRLFREARARRPPVTLLALAEACGMTEVAVLNSLRAKTD